MLRRIFRWMTDPARVTWLPYAIVASVLLWILFPLDELVYGWIRATVPEEFQRWAAEGALYGVLGFIVLVALGVWLGDPPRRARLADLLASLVITGIATLALKILLGRPRPILDEPEMFLGPLGAYPLGPEIGFRASWQVWEPYTSVLWSMPSGAAAYLGAAAAFAAAVYPRLWPIAAASIIVGALAIAISPEQYPTDIIAGLALGLAVGHSATRFGWGRRVVGKGAFAQADQTPPAPLNNPPSPSSGG